jgi:protein TonB
MKLWIIAAVLALCCAGCESTEGLVADRPVSNEVKFAGEYLPLEEVDQQPVIESQVAPTFPSVMRKARIDGKVLIVLLVDTSGNPQQVQVEQATHPLFADAALTAVRKWKFKPATKGGQAVTTSLTLPIEFRRELTPGGY